MAHKKENLKKGQNTHNKGAKSAKSLPKKAHSITKAESIKSTPTKQVKPKSPKPKSIKLESTNTLESRGKKEAKANPKKPKFLQETHIQNNTEKAYKLLASQQNISTNKAKSLIDSGMVSIKGKRLLIARTLLPKNTRFEVMESQCSVIFEDSDILVLDKSVGVESYSLLDSYPHCKLINRLDKDTSGVILLAKHESMRKKAIAAFRQKKVEKIYLALIEGKLYEEISIDKKISTKKDSKAKSFIDEAGLSAKSVITPLQIFERTTLVSIQIETGRTHQIRIHLASLQHPIVGDIIYNKDSTINAKRLMLHCQKTALLGYTFQSNADAGVLFGI